MLVIANATSPDAAGDASAPAFTEAECDTVRDWVRAGGSLLLIADHTPFGSAAANLGQRFGVEMGRGFVVDLRNSQGGSPSTLVFSRENELLGDHALLRGREGATPPKK